MNRQFFAFALFLFFLTASAVPAQAFGDLVTPISPVNLRKARDLNSAPVDVLMPGEVVRVDFLRDGWYAVFRANQTVREEAKARGFARADYFKPAPGPAGTKAPLPEQALVPASTTAGSGEQHPPVPGGEQTSTPVRPAPPSPSAEFPATAPAPAALQPAVLSRGWGELCAADRQLAIRKSRSPDSEHVKTLKAGDVVKVDFLDDGWYAVFDPREPVRDLSRALGYSYAKFLVPAGKSALVAAAPAVIPPPRMEPRLEPVTPPMAVRPPGTAASSTAAWGRLTNLARRLHLSRRPSQYAGFTRTLEPGTAVRLDVPEKGWVAVYDPAQATHDPAQVWGYAAEADLEAPAAVPEAAAAKPEPAPAVVAPASETPAPAQSPARTPATSTAAPAPALTAPSKAPAAASLPINPFAVRRPEKPVADKVLHGFRYGVFDVDEERVGDIGVIEMKVYLDVTVLPSPEEIADLAASIWKEKRQSGKEVVVDVYLPDTDVNGLAYAVGRFNARGLVEFWTRKTILYGTRFQR